jgi:DNA-binding NtrC family response regulator
VVLLDLVLPDGSGMDLVADIKALPHAEVVLITGHARWRPRCRHCAWARPTTSPSR